MSLDICRLIEEGERFHTCKGVFYNFTEEVIEKIAHYLEGIGMPEEHIRRVIFDATRVGMSSLTERCEEALKHLTVAELIELIDYGFFCPLFGTDMANALKFASETLGDENLMGFIRKHPKYLEKFMDESVCWEPAYFDELEEAVRMVSIYKSTLERKM